ncbi:class I SAM-dependent methyltransferase [Bacillus sp. MRMR6]|uniref:class I SAM-dependent methyltransferase n=1 Tax=Bacillus sp. MRMR6 TaxID=1928617 RepID=UPI000952A0F6|nr:class I SAM-dependent methyltransferase [Bacillus sp. MRMR6]OLS33715.1 SAM-dependent methyltransferase [Bacillus sp. MRMR6]
MDYTYLDCLAIFGVGGAHPGGLKLTKQVLSKEKLDERKSILDVGCGTGQTSAYLAEQFKCKVTSLDYNKIMLEKAKNRFQSLGLPIEVKYGKAENLPFGDTWFDFILSESVTSFTEIPLAIHEYKRVLKPGGVLLAIEMVLEKPLKQDEVKTIKQFYGVSQLLTEKEWASYFKEAGFEKINIEKFKHALKEPEVENAVDFSLSEDISEDLFDILEKHEKLTKGYEDALGYRLFRCNV